MHMRSKTKRAVFGYIQPLRRYDVTNTSYCECIICYTSVLDGLTSKVSSILKSTSIGWYFGLNTELCEETVLIRFFIVGPIQYRGISLASSGSVAEWSKALVLGTSHFGGVGSNPTTIKMFILFNFSKSWISFQSSNCSTERKNQPTELK